MKSMKQIFSARRSDAYYRGIAWELTYDEWWKIWNDSGKWGRRGNRSGQYCMARYGDVGPYAVGNVRIITCNENHREKTFSHTSNAIVKIGNASRGRVLSNETKRKIGEAKRGKRISRRRRNVLPESARVREV